MAKKNVRVYFGTFIDLEVDGAEFATDKEIIDYVEEKDGAFSIFEMKWNPKKANAKIPAIFESTYQLKSFNVVTPENYLEFV